MPRPSQKKRLRKKLYEQLSATERAEKAAKRAEEFVRCEQRKARRAKEEEAARTRKARQAGVIAAARGAGLAGPIFKQANRSETSGMSSNTDGARGPPAPLQQGSAQAPDVQLQTSFLQIIPGDELVIERVVGEGASAAVFSAAWNGRRVAVKELKTQVLSEGTLASFTTELSAMTRLHHPNICRLWGACLQPLRIVMEFAEHGSLWSVARTQVLDDARRVQMAKEIASAMAFVHSFERSRLYQDLKSSSVLVTADFAIKIGIKMADFGLPRVKQEAPTKGVRDTVHWMAPEVISQKVCSEKVDAYAFSIILWELFTAESPYGSAPPHEILTKVSHGYRPAIPKWAPLEFSQLIEDCWAQDPTKRPPFTGIVRYLSTAYPSHS